MTTRDAAQIHVRLTPRGGRDAIAGWRDGELHIRVSAPAIDGRANEALIRLLARALGVARSRVTIVHGERARLKHIAVEGMSLADAERRLG
ncbi:MAG TPA: DUF167 domain-containing protein [Dehalococcoidia bacterium]|nr:DUF167 domain-containing protein [Dehalococcoidia bacterium]